MDTKILLVLGILVIFVASAYVIFELPKNKINEYGNLSFNKNNSDNQNTPLPMETNECSEYKKQECPKTECQNTECPKCPEKINEGKIIYIETRLNNTGNANLSDGRIKFYLNDTMKVESSLNNTFILNSSMHDKAIIIYNVNYSCEKCKECHPYECGSCYCPSCICPKSQEKELPEISVISISLNPETIMNGEEVNISVLIKNSKDVSIGYVKVLLEIDNFTSQKYIYLGANSTENVSFEWFAKEGNHTINVKADPDNLINKTNESNNNYTTNITVLPEVCDPYNFTEVWNSGDLIDGIVNGIATGDLDGDGNDEVVAVTTEYYNNNWYGKNAIYIFKNNGNDNYTLSWNSSEIGGRSVAIADVDHDKELEIVVGNSKHLECHSCLTKKYSGESGLYVLKKIDNSYTVVWNESINVNSVVVGDINSDCKQEIVAGGENGIFIYKNNGSDYSLLWNSSVGVNSVAVGDINGDTENEIVVNKDSNFYIFKSNESSYSLVGNVSISATGSHTIETIMVKNIDGLPGEEIVAAGTRAYIFKCNLTDSCIEVHQEVFFNTIMYDITTGRVDEYGVSEVLLVGYYGISAQCWGSNILIFKWNDSDYKNVFKRAPFLYGASIKSMAIFNNEGRELKLVFGLKRGLSIVKIKCKKGDYNCDCKINNQDFISFANVYNKTPAPSWANFNNDDKINNFDLQEFIKRMS